MWNNANAQGRWIRKLTIRILHHKTITFNDYWCFNNDCTAIVTKDSTSSIERKIYTIAHFENISWPSNVRRRCSPNGKDKPENNRLLNSWNNHPFSRHDLKIIRDMSPSNLR